MKSFLRSGPGIAMAGWLIWVWMILLSASVRWRVEGEPEAKAAWQTATSGAIIACWHQGIFLLPSGWRRHIRRWPGRDLRTAMMVSRSPDSMVTASAIARLKIELIWGSAANKKKAEKDKGGVKAAIAAVRYLRDNGSVCITLDGPRGPALEVQPGVIMIAQKSGAPILPYAIMAAPAKRAGSWDRMFLPLPFSRGAIVFGPMLDVPRDGDEQALRLELQARMQAATERARLMLGLPPES